jgi:uncharacterized BrkB/YihY/UPF0761 family membrane protein
MKTRILWTGIIILVVGIVLSVYGYSEIQTIGQFWYLPQFQQRHQIAQISEALGIGLIVLGLAMSLYGVVTKTKQV